MGLGQGTSLSLRPGELRAAAGTLGVCGWGAWGGARQQAFLRYSGGGRGQQPRPFSLLRENYKQMWAPQEGREQGARTSFRNTEHNLTDCGGGPSRASALPELWRQSGPSGGPDRLPTHRARPDRG